MADERPPDESAVEAPVRPQDNVVPFPTRPTPAEPVTAEELRERLDRITAGADDLLAGTTRIETALEQAKVDRLARLEKLVEPIAAWVSTGAEERSREISTLTATMAEGFAAATAARLLESSVEAKARASMRAELASIAAELASTAARVELLEHPDPQVREVAAEAATGNPEAIDELAARLSQQSTWWERNGSLVTTVAMSLLFIAAAALITAGALSRRERRRLEAEQRRALEHRVRQVESNYVQLHGAYSQQQRALAAEQQRPLVATYDQRSFPVYDQHWHEHHHEQHDHQTVIEVDASDVADELAPRVAGLIPPSTNTTIVQPTVHTRERVHTRDRVHTREKITKTTTKEKTIYRNTRAPRAQKREAENAVADVAPSQILADAIARRGR